MEYWLHCLRLLSKRLMLAGDRRATTNKGAWQWATAQGPQTAWELEARWVADGPVWTSAGVTAGEAQLARRAYNAARLELVSASAAVRHQLGHCCERLCLTAASDQRAQCARYLPWCNVMRISSRQGFTGTQDEQENQPTLLLQTHSLPIGYGWVASACLAQPLGDCSLGSASNLAACQFPSQGTNTSRRQV